MDSIIKLYLLMNEFEEEDLFLLEFLNYCNCTKTLKIPQIILAYRRENHSRSGLHSEMWIDLYTEYDFFIHFRMKRKTFHDLLRLMMQQPGFERVFHGGLQPVTPEKTQQVSIYYLAYQMPLVEIADKFNVATSTVLNCVDYWIKHLLRLSQLLIRWPAVNERAAIIEKFQNLVGFPGVIGATDGCHVNIMTPADQQRRYQNRYTCHSTIFQGICTADCLLTNVYVGHPGSANDCRVLANSKLCMTIEEHGPSQFFMPDQHLLGDKIYPLKTWLLPPFKDYGNVTTNQRNYDRLHSSTSVATI